MAGKSIDWHYPRAALAAELFDAMASATLMRGTIYAARRKGKTEFLLRDLLPLAQKAGWPVAYANLWAYLDMPHLALKDGLAAAEKYQSRLTSWLPKPNKLGGGFDLAGLAKVEAQVEFSQNPKVAPPQDLVMIQQAMAKLASAKKPLLLLVDEAQHLATSDQFRVFAYFLRTQIDTLGTKIRVVFTGSNRAALARTFSANDMPFYQSAVSIRFPELDSGFFKHLAACYEAATQRRFSAQDLAALKAFYEEFGSCPFFPVKVIQQMIINGTARATGAIDDFRDEWRSQHVDMALSDVQNWTLERIRSGEKLYAADALDMLGKQLGKSPESTRQLVKRSLADLQQMAMITKTGRGKYAASPA